MIRLNYRYPWLYKALLRIIRLTSSFCYFIIVCLFLGPFISSSYSQENNKPDIFNGVGVRENIGQYVAHKISLTDYLNQEKSLGQYFDKKLPVIVNMVYYRCPMLCSLILNGLVEALNKSNLTLGKDYRLLTLSFDPTDTVQLAEEFRKSYLPKIRSKSEDADWPFFILKEHMIKSVTDSLGFYYRYDQKSKEYAHNDVTFFLSPNGKISRYLYGVKYRARDVQLALAESRLEKGGYSVERVLLFCYNYNPNTGQYTPIAVNIMKIACTITVLLLLITVILLKRNEEKA